MYMQLQFLSDINSGTFGLEKIGILVFGAKIDCFLLSCGIGGTTEFFKKSKSARNFNNFYQHISVMSFFSN